MGCDGLGLEVDRAALRRHSCGFGDGAQALRRIRTRLEEAQSAEGRCWGGDEGGVAFAGTYDPPRLAAGRIFTGLEHGLARIEDALRSMAATYEQAENASGG